MRKSAPGKLFYLMLMVGYLVATSAVNAATLLTPSQVVSQLNVKRKKINCPPLLEAPKIASAIAKHLADMEANNFSSSTGSDGSSTADRLAREGYQFTFAAETFTPNQDNLVEKWWANPNMQGMFNQCDYQEIGLGYTKQFNSWYIIISIPQVPSTPTRPTTPTIPTTPSDPSLVNMRNQILKLTNIERAKYSCPPLVLNDKLNTAAQKHTEDMSVNNFFSHTGSNGSDLTDRLKAVNYRYMMAAENIAAGYGSPEQTMQGWMNSPGHRANILNCQLKDLGVGYANSSHGDYGAYGTYWTQDFGSSY